MNSNTRGFSKRAEQALRAIMTLDPAVETLADASAIAESVFAAKAERAKPRPANGRAKSLNKQYVVDEERVQKIERLLASGLSMSEVGCEVYGHQRRVA